MAAGRRRVQVALYSATETIRKIRKSEKKKLTRVLCQYVCTKVRKKTGKGWMG